MENNEKRNYNQDERNYKIENNQNDSNLDIAHKYYWGANQKNEGFLDNSEYNSTSSTFRPEDPKLDENGHQENSFDFNQPTFDQANSTFKFDNFDEERIYDSIFDKENQDDISESGYDKKIGMQKRDDARFK